MFKLNSIFKILIVVFLSLVIPSFLSIFKISFDEYISAQKADVQGASIVKVKTQTGKDTTSSKEQTVSVDFALPKVGSIQNLSQRPFNFPKTQAVPVSAPINTMAPVSYAPIKPIYNDTNDKGRAGQSFLFTYIGMQGSKIAFYNGNEYDLNNVKISIVWVDGVNEFTSMYTTFKVEKQLYYYEDKNNTIDATIPLNPQKKIKSITVTFRDNSGQEFQEEI